MAGTKAGGQKTKATNKAKYGDDFYQNIGKVGGKAKVPKGFALMDKDRLSAISKKGGSVKR